MSSAEQIFLIGILAAFSLFAVVLAFAARTSPFRRDDN
jgi:hypothetical protein